MPGHYNRISALANRSRTMNKERFDLVAQLSALKTKGAPGWNRNIWNCESQPSTNSGTSSIAAHSGSAAH